MNDLGAVSGKLQREVELLRELNNALLVIEASALEKGSDFGFSPDDVLKSRGFLVDFIKRLCSALKQESSPSHLQPIIDHLKSGMKPIKDWIDDLGALNEQLQADEKLTDDSLATLEEILSLLDSQFTGDLQRLYAR
jgi:Sec7-like guanine-nucleotide exchange factor